MTWKTIHNEAPKYLGELVRIRQGTVRQYRKIVLEVPLTCQVTRGDRSFGKMLAKLKNELPIHISSCETLNSFKSTLKTQFFSKSIWTFGNWINDNN